jgi:hypothetical protein
MRMPKFGTYKIAELLTSAPSERAAAPALSQLPGSRG